MARTAAAQGEGEAALTWVEWSVMAYSTVCLAIGLRAWFKGRRALRRVEAAARRDRDAGAAARYEQRMLSYPEPTARSRIKVEW